MHLISSTRSNLNFYCNMASKLFMKYAVLSGVSISSFIAGIYFEKKYIDLNCSPNLYLNKEFPIFQSVFAATPFSSPPEGQDKLLVNRVGDIMKYGFPGMDNIRSFDDYVLSYDRRNRVAHWVFERLTAENIKFNENVDREKCEFKVDESIHPYFRSDNSDYKSSGYDRGHLAAAGNHKAHQIHLEQTFFLSNITPQVGKGFNRDAWNRLEKYVRKLVKSNKNVYVCTGPLYLPRKGADGKTYVTYEVLGANHVAVPTHFFKVVAVETKDAKFELEAYIMPNQAIDKNTPLFKFMALPEFVEKASGLLFFDAIARKRFSKINGKENTSQ